MRSRKPSGVGVDAEYNPSRVARRLELTDKHGFAIVAPEDASWPRRLAALGDAAPLLLWCRRNPEALRRACHRDLRPRAATSYGEQVALNLTSDLIANGHVIITGATYEERVFESEMRAWKAAREHGQEANPDVPVSDYPAAAAAAAAAAEVAAVAATAARETLENTTAAEGISAGEQQWSTDYAAVAQAESAAQTAFVFRRSAAQKGR